MIRKIIVILVLFFPFLLCLGQETDVQLWLTANVRKDLGKKFRLYYEQGYRSSDEFLIETSAFTFEPGVMYKPWKFLWVGAYYRHYNNFRGSRDNTLAGVLLLRKDVKRFDFKFRTRYIYEFVSGNDDHYLRERITAGYNIPKCKINPFIASELTFHFQTSKTELEQIRYYIGAKYNIAKHHAIDFSYRYSHEMNVKNPRNLHTIGIDYIFDF